MNCNFATEVSDKINSCALGFYNGKPSKMFCEHCMSFGGNKIENANLNLPQQAISFGKSIANWSAGGFFQTPSNIFSERKAICRACPEWDACALNGTGRCKKCGCSTWAKLRMATEKCPIGKWGSVDKSTNKNGA